MKFHLLTQQHKVRTWENVLLFSETEFERWKPSYLYCKAFLVLASRR